MKFLVVVAMMVVGAMAVDSYSTEMDNFDIEALVAQPEGLKNFNKCFLETGPCNDTAAHFKQDMKDAVETACQKCTEAQKHIFKVYLSALKEKLPDEYEAFKNKYDPEDKYFSALENTLNSS